MNFDILKLELEKFRQVTCKTFDDSTTQYNALEYLEVIDAIDTLLEKLG